MAIIFLAAAAMAVNSADPCAWAVSAARVACLAYVSYLGLYWPACAYLGLLGFADLSLVCFALLSAFLAIHLNLIVACLVLR